MSEIAGRIGQPATSLSRALGRLIALELVRREQPFGDAERTGKRALYRINDPFFRFWFRVVAPHRGLLAVEPAKVRRALWQRSAQRLFAETWEDLCRQAVPRLDFSRRSGVGPFGPAARYWRGNGPEWDVVAASLDADALLLGEAKWRNHAVGEEELDGLYGELARKGEPDVGTKRAGRVVHAVFVPECTPAARRKKRPYALFEARDVLAALR